MLALCVNTALGKWCVLCSSKDLQGRGRGKKRDKKVYAMLLKRLLHTSFTHSRLNIHHKTCALLLLVNNRSYILKKITGADLHCDLQKPAQQRAEHWDSFCPKACPPSTEKSLRGYEEATLELPAAGRDWGRHWKVSDSGTLKTREVIQRRDNWQWGGQWLGLRNSEDPSRRPSAVLCCHPASPAALQSIAGHGMLARSLEQRQNCQNRSPFCHLPCISLRQDPQLEVL